MAHGTAAVRQDPFARLDAWVLEELEALSAPRSRTTEKVRRRAPPEPANFDVPADGGPLPLDEGQFVQRVTEWLHGRPNADLILEEIWRNVVATDDEGELDDLGESESGVDAAAELRADAEGADEAPEGPAGLANDPEPPLSPQG
jgi:hypothetical protein